MTNSNHYNEKISVIIPIYNSEKYLEKCIKSVISQTYTNLEILLINDGSTDNSIEICNKYSKIDNRIRVIDKCNEGVSATKNLGISLSTGNYISFIDSDDWITDDYFQVLYENLNKTNSDISIVSYNVVRENGSIIPNAVIDTGLSENEVMIYENDDIIKELLKQKTIKNFVCKLYTKSVINNFKFPTGVTYEDIVFTFDVMNNSKKVVFINRKCYNYVKREGSITATISEKNLIDFANAIYERFLKVNEHFPQLLDLNMYAFLESTLALSIKFVINDENFEELKSIINKYIYIILHYTKDNEVDFFTLLNDYQKACIYLMKYNTDLFLSFLKERQKLKILGKIN